MLVWRTTVSSLGMRNDRDKERTKASTGWKSLVDPDSNLYKYSVHEGFVAYMRKPNARADNQTCAYMGHIRNAFRTRVSKFDTMEQSVDDWLWPLRV